MSKIDRLRKRANRLKTQAVTYNNLLEEQQLNKWNKMAYMDTKWRERAISLCEKLTKQSQELFNQIETELLTINI